MQHAGFPHEGRGDGMGLRDDGQLLIEHAGKGEQVVALVLQGNAQRANTPLILGLALCQFGNDEVDSSCRVASAGPASAKTSWLNHWVSIRLSRANRYA